MNGWCEVLQTIASGRVDIGVVLDEHRQDISASIQTGNKRGCHACIKQYKMKQRGTTWLHTCKQRTCFGLGKGGAQQRVANTQTGRTDRHTDADAYPSRVKVILASQRANLGHPKS